MGFHKENQVEVSSKTGIAYSIKTSIGTHKQIVF